MKTTIPAIFALALSVVLAAAAEARGAAPSNAPGNIFLAAAKSTDTANGQHPAEKNIDGKKQDRKAAHGTEDEIDADLFSAMQNLLSVRLGSKTGPVKMVMFSRDGCPPCARMKSTLRKQKVSFGILEIPIAWNREDEEKLLKKFGATEKNRKELLERIRESANFLKDVMGSLAVPIYAWRMPNNTCRMGFLQPLAVQARLKNLEEEKDQSLSSY